MKQEAELRPGVRQNFDQIFETAERSLSNGTLIPALILLYSAMDIAAGLARTEVSSKRRFVKWVDDYMAPERRLSCRALDLYGARCGLLHGSSPVSDLSQRGEVKQILYSWGKSGPKKLRELIGRAQMDHYVVIHADELLNAARHAVENFLHGVTKTPAELERVNRKALLVFGPATDANIDALLEWGKEKLDQGFSDWSLKP
jgi:hypothetical protein